MTEFPWFFSHDDTVFAVMRMLEAGPLTYEEIGMLDSACKTKTKFNTQRHGQANCTVPIMLGLVEHKDGKSALTPLGREFCEQSLNRRVRIFTKMLFRIPLIRNIYRTESTNAESIAKIAVDNIGGSSKNRRKISTMYLIDEIQTLLELETGLVSPPGRP